ncbi:phosphohistidine phosphatase [Octadecabacter temperatus]|uniref:Histidine phosphatase superfamily (Branch 1) n=1 Tax=Octadecabacter temperatus TaxID=1458307 RepID=A0A0K0Y1S4_9RHOB|nr:histidine phosphatase family protein [Octadecabacter temperatus]AKS44884.1 Histidine phosphatase superfamily (branch 1) [Octadecabacter temperatus]SIO34096.1 phosphohistidine phosphatase [Octadecabacter temperatus]
MTKRLILIRHAKSSWEAPFDDHARTLNARGQEAVTAIGGWLKSKGYLPDTIYSSDAARTMETTERLVAALGTAPSITFKDNMYHAPPATLMRMLKKANGDTVALVAHNPGIAFFAEEIVAQKPDHRRFLDYPTCATLVCDFPINNWAEAVSRSGQVVDFVVPKDLA